MEQPFALDGYALTDLIGFGATGEVWRGRDETSHEPVALKRLWEPATEGVVERLRQDAAVVAEVAGPHAVRILEVAVLAGGEVIVVMDYAGGGSLASLLARRGRLHPSEVVTIIGPLAQALAELHRRGIVHGDLTPSNVLLAADGRPMLADVGLAIATGEQAGDDVGYRDPALDSATPATGASDCFALAALGYAALTGVPPRSASRPDVIESIVGRAPWVPEALATVIESALTADPALRPDVATFGVAVLAACGAAPVRLTGPRRTPEADVARTAVEPVPRRRPRRLVLAGVVAAVLGGAALVGVGSARFNTPRASALQPARPADAAVSGHSASDHTPRWTDGSPYRPTVAHLFALRARAYRTGDPSLLREAYAPVSLAYRMDSAELEVLRSRQLRARNFAQRVESITTVGFSRGWVMLEVTATIPDWTVVDRTGRVVAHRAGRTQHFDMTIVRHGGEWRIKEVDQPPRVAARP